MGGLGRGKPKTGEQEERREREGLKGSRSEIRGTCVDPEKSVGPLSSASSSRAAAGQAGLGCFLRRAGDIQFQFPFSERPNWGAGELHATTAPNHAAIHAILSGARLPDGLLECFPQSGSASNGGFVGAGSEPASSPVSAQAAIPVSCHEPDVLAAKRSLLRTGALQ
jgi:hypothetical protein